MSTKDFRTRDEIVISIKGKARAEISEADKRRGKGSVPPGKKDKRFLHRRTTGGLINFWDLGQLANGTDLTFHVMPDVNILGGVTIDVESFDLHWPDLETAVFANAPATWKTAYKKLSFEAAERYGVDVVDNDTGDAYPAARNGSRLDSNSVVVAGTKWKEGGLELPAGVVNFSIVSNGAFEWFDNGDFVKVTNGPTFASPEVAFTLARKADFFLMPYIVAYTLGGNNGVDSETLIGRYGALRRSVWLNRNFSDSGFPALSLGTETFSGGDRSAFLADGRTPGRNFQSSGGITSEVSPSLFPTYAGSVLQVIGSPEGTLPEGTFLGAVFQNGSMFYFWRVDATGGVIVTRNITIN